MSIFNGLLGRSGGCNESEGNSSLLFFFLLLIILFSNSDCFGSDDSLLFFFLLLVVLFCGCGSSSPCALKDSDCGCC